MENKDFCIFILTHGRAEKVYTYNSLMRRNCKYPIYFIVDNEDSQIEQYCKKFGKERVIIFDKLEVSKTFDTADNFENRGCIVYARNYCFQAAKDLGYKYFLQLDDDYTDFRFKFDSKDNYGDFMTKRIDEIFDIFLRFYKNTEFKTITFCQGGDFIGGKRGSMALSKKIKRKAMNSFFCCIDREFTFLGRINEDVNTYCYEGSKGNLFGALSNFALQQKQSQLNSGGMTETYLDSGTYLKSFYSVIFCPSFVKISLMGSVEKRLHHRISWNNAVPKILSEELKKK